MVKDYKRKTCLQSDMSEPAWKNLKIEIKKKMWYLKTITEQVILGDPWVWLRKGQLNILTRYMAIPANMIYKNLLFAELLISFGEYSQCGWKISPKRSREKYKYIKRLSAQESRLDG